MANNFPIEFKLSDGTGIKVYQEEESCYQFFMTRLNSEKHNFYLKDGQIVESYETRFDRLQNEAVAIFNSMIIG
jgi:hypothetical protein